MFSESIVGSVLALPAEASNDVIDKHVHGLLSSMKLEDVSATETTDAGGSPATPSASSELASGRVSELAAELQIAASEGFDLRGSIGNRWAKALATSAELKRDYVACGKKYSMQRDLRQA